MKVAILHSGDLEKISPGGISQYIEKIIKYNEKNDITIFGTVDLNSKYKLNTEYEKFIDGKKYKLIPISTNKRNPLSIFYFISLFKYFSVLKEYDVIYAQRMEYALPFTFSKLRKKLIMAVHGSGMYSYMYWGKVVGVIYNLVERVAIRNSKKVVVLLKRKEFGLPYYKNKFKKYNSKFEYGKVPIDLDIFKKLNKNDIRSKLEIKENEKVIIYFGRIDNNPKRVLLIPRIASKLTKIYPDIKFVIIGDGEDKNKLEKLVFDYKLENNIIIKGRLSHGNDLVEWINGSNISLILSSFEGICMSALESLACGVPVIATDVGDIKEYINNGYNGKIIKNSINDEKLICDLTLAIYECLEKKVKINDVYINYEGNKVIAELESIFLDIVRSN